VLLLGEMVYPASWLAFAAEKTRFEQVETEGPESGKSSQNPVITEVSLSL
jgi:hypothetical protein